MLFAKFRIYLSHFRLAYSIPLEFFLIAIKFRIRPTTGPRILAQLVDNELTYFHRLYHLCKTGGFSEITWVLTRGDRNEKRGFVRDIFRLILTSPLSDVKNKVLYQGTFGGKIAAKFYKKSKFSKEVQAIANEMMDSVKNIDDLLQLHVREIKVGDLIYDSYLRFKPAPTLNFEDQKYLRDLYNYAAKVLVEFNSVITNKRYDLYVSTYCSYIEHGIPVRLCLKNNVPVICTGAQNQILVQPTKEFPFHKRNFHNYSNWITPCNRENILTLGQNILRSRFKGEIDPVTGYMKQSAFSGVIKTDLISPGINKCIILAHDFFDSPHVYGDMLFADYYKWLEFVLSIASECSSHTYFCKPHPNAVKDSLQYYEKFKDQFPKINFLDPKVSNNLIIESGFACGFTLNGTVGHEFPYGGIPIVSAGENPHSSFSFCIIPKNLDELIQFIRNPELVNNKNDKTQIELFAGVHSWRMFQDKAKDLFPWIKTPKELLSSLSEGMIQDKMLIIKREIENLQGL